MSFQQGLSGLNAAAKNLDVIGNNVANSGTVGFKQGQTQFADMYANSMNGSGASVVGIGVNVANVSQQFTQGNVSSSGNPLDIAIKGSGFFCMVSNGVHTYGRNGQFELDNQGYIVNPSQGYARLTGYGTVLNATTGLPIPDGNPGTELKVDTTDIAPKATTGATMNLALDSRSPVLDPLSFNRDDPTTYTWSTSLPVYDSLGNAHSLRTYYVKTDDNEWSVFAADENGNAVDFLPGPTSSASLTFGTNGAIDTDTATPPFKTQRTVSMAVGGGAATPVAVNIDFYPSTQYGSPSGVNAATQNGYASGRLSGFNISPDGSLLGKYTNGQSRLLGQVTLTTFANPNGLQPLGNNLWIDSAASGPALTGAPNTGNLGVLQSHATEDSNVDLTAELVNMITAQRAYQANAQTIKTQDQMMQTLVNLR